MLKRALLPAFAAFTLAAAAIPTANAGVMLNGVMLNGSGPGDDATVRAVRLTLPDGAQLTFR